MKREIILASRSQRRSRILSECGIRHKVIPSDIKEYIEKNKHISEIVRINAVRKAELVAAKSKKAIVIGADTLVVHRGKIIGKPKNAYLALKILKAFSKDKLEIYTGLCVIDTFQKRKASGFQKSSLLVAALLKKEVKRYFNLLGPYDKAGGFSIEGIGGLIFDNIKGSYFNILGLPMALLAKLFKHIDLDILDYVS